MVMVRMQCSTKSRMGNFHLHGLDPFCLKPKGLKTKKGTWVPFMEILLWVFGIGTFDKRPSTNITWYHSMWSYFGQETDYKYDIVPGSDTRLCPSPIGASFQYSRESNGDDETGLLEIWLMLSEEITAHPHRNKERHSAGVYGFYRGFCPLSPPGYQRRGIY